MKRFPPFFILLAIVFLFSAPASAKIGRAHALGTFGNWKAYSFTEGKATVCYMMLSAHMPRHKGLKRGTTYLMITHRPAENSLNVVSYMAGYKFKPSSDVKMKIGDETFDLFTQKDTAWSRDALTDHKLTLAIRKGYVLSVVGKPDARHVYAITDKLSLKGSNAAYEAMSKACGVHVESIKPAAVHKTVKKKAHKASKKAAHKSHKKAKKKAIKHRHK